MKFWMHVFPLSVVLLMLSTPGVTAQGNGVRVSAEVFPCNETLAEIDFDSAPFPLVKGSTIRMCIAPSALSQGFVMRSIDRFIFSKGEDNSGGRQIVIGRGSFADGDGTVVSCERGQSVCSFTSPLKDEFFLPSTVGAETGIGYIEARGEVTLELRNDANRPGGRRQRTLLRKTFDLQLAPRGLQGAAFAGEAIVTIDQIPIKEDVLPAEEEEIVPEEDDPNPVVEFWDGLSSGAKIGIIAGLSLAFCICCCCFLFVLNHSRSRNQKSKEARAPRLRYLPNFGFGHREEEFHDENEVEYEEDEEDPYESDEDDDDDTSGEEDLEIIDENDDDSDDDSDSDSDSDDDDDEDIEQVPAPIPPQPTGPRRASSYDPKKPRRGDAHRASVAQQRDSLRASSYHGSHRRGAQSMYQERSPSSPKPPTRRSESLNSASAGRRVSSASPKPVRKMYRSQTEAEAEADADSDEDLRDTLSRQAAPSKRGRKSSVYGGGGDDDAIPDGSQRSTASRRSSIGSQRSRSSVKRKSRRKSFAGDDAGSSPKRGSSIPRKSSLRRNSGSHSRRTSIRKPPSMRRVHRYNNDDPEDHEEDFASDSLRSRRSSQSPGRRSSQSPGRNPSRSPLPRRSSLSSRSPLPRRSSLSSQSPLPRRSSQSPLPRRSSQSPMRSSSKSPRQGRRSVPAPPIPPPGLDDDDDDLYSLDGDEGRFQSDKTIHFQQR